MKISIIGPALPIPPKGWGAVESLIWDYKIFLEKLNHDVQIINISDPNQIINKINQFNPDFVHINYDDWIVLYPYIQYPCACTTHYAYIDQFEKMGGYQNIFNVFAQYKPNIFCLSETIKNVYKNVCGISSDNLYLTPNGVNIDAFRKVDNPLHYDKSIYLAKIDYRKRQHLFQSIDNLWYAGNVADSRFDVNKNYLGEFTKPQLYDKLTEYGNLVLLSDGEAHPLVCMEALASGLGLVISEYSTANLDLSKQFIDVIPEDKIYDIEYIKNIINKNREYSIKNRNEIYEYSKIFNWETIIQNYFIPSVKKLINSYNR
jgi:glycosyltransferase involved in cell wall biosynthesis